MNTVKIALLFVPIVESVVRSAIHIFAKVVELATNVPEVKEISAMVAIYAIVVR